LASTDGFADNTEAILAPDVKRPKDRTRVASEKFLKLLQRGTAVEVMDQLCAAVDRSNLIKRDDFGMTVMKI
jgi:hypothetical protein